MESDWIFVYNQLPTLPEADEIRVMIQARDGKPIGWFEIEALLAMTPSVNMRNAIDSLVIQSAKGSEALNAELSGPIEILDTAGTLEQRLLDLNLGDNFGVSFAEFRENVWTKTKSAFWPDFQIRWDINGFVGRMFLLNNRMKSVYLIN